MKPDMDTIKLNIDTSNTKNDNWPERELQNICRQYEIPNPEYGDLKSIERWRIKVEMLLKFHLMNAADILDSAQESEKGGYCQNLKYWEGVWEVFKVGK